MVKSRPIPLTDKEVADLIRYYENLKESAIFLEITAQYQIGQTLRLLRQVEAGHLSK